MLFNVFSCYENGNPLLQKGLIRLGMVLRMLHKINSWRLSMPNTFLKQTGELKITTAPLFCTSLPFYNEGICQLFSACALGTCQWLKRKPGAQTATPQLPLLGHREDAWKAPLWCYKLLQR